MSYKTNAIINRVRQTIGWQPWVSSGLPLKTLTVQNIFGFKIAYFLKHWFKNQNWVLLNIKRVNSRQTQIWYVTALRTPVPLTDLNRGIPYFEQDEDTAKAAKNAFIYKKRLNVMLKRYKEGKKTFFNFTTKHQLAKSKNVLEHYKKVPLKNQNKKSWLRTFFGFYKFGILNKKQTIKRKIGNKREFIKAFPYKRLITGSFFFPTREWKKINTRKLLSKATRQEESQKIYKRITLSKKSRLRFRRKVFYVNGFYRKKTNNKNKQLTRYLRSPKQKTIGDYVNSSYWNIKNTIRLKRKNKIIKILNKFNIKTSSFRFLINRQNYLKFSKLSNNVSKKIRKNKYLLINTVRRKVGFKKWKRIEKLVKIKKIKDRLEPLLLKKKILQLKTRSSFFKPVPILPMFKEDEEDAIGINQQDYKNENDLDSSYENAELDYDLQTELGIDDFVNKKEMIIDKKQLKKEFKIWKSNPKIIKKKIFFNVLKPKLNKKISYVRFSNWLKKHRNRKALCNSIIGKEKLELEDDMEGDNNFLFISKQSISNKHLLNKINEEINESADFEDYDDENNVYVPTYSIYWKERKKKLSTARKFSFNFKKLYKKIIKIKKAQSIFSFYAKWRKIYFLKLAQKRTVIKKFLALWKKAKKTKRNFLNFRKPKSRRKKKFVFNKNRNLKNSPIYNKLVLWTNIKRKTPLRKYKKNKKLNINKFVKIYERRTLQKTKAKKFAYLRTTKMNYLFKKALRLLFKRAYPGLAAVKFLQPTGTLLSIRKVRAMAARISDLKRYKSQKLYRRFIRILSIFFRYWHPQPLLEQIAFEMEKTKKHWPILKSMRTLLFKLKPAQFYGYRIAVRGKINSSDRTRVFFIKHGNDIPVSTFTNRMLYSMCRSHARTGVFSIKGWVYLPPAKKILLKTSN